MPAAPGSQYGHRVRARPPRLDVILAGLLTVLGVVEATWGLTGDREPWYVVLSVPVVTAPVAVRRLMPVTAVAVMSTGLALQSLLGSSLPGGFSEAVALVLVVYAVGAVLDLRRSVAVVLLIAAVQVAVIVIEGDARAGNFVYALTVVAVAWLAGRGVRLADERSRLLAERRAVQERSRIARELHDVVSHHVTAMVVQAGAERRDHPDGSGTAQVLETIEQQGRETLRELRRLLGLLRMDGDGPPLAPQPGLGDLAALLDAARSSGLDVSLTTTGDPVSTGDGVGLAVYRVVQECLTNVRKHAAAPRAEVRLRWQPGTLSVDVLSPGPRQGRILPGSGLGLTAMAERVQAYGGTLTTGITDQGFRVQASLPLDGAR
jgi:signal transduction histidine kinase